jgi:hypothetical protein
VLLPYLPMAIILLCYFQGRSSRPRRFTTLGVLIGGLVMAVGAPLLYLTTAGWLAVQVTAPDTVIWLMPIGGCKRSQVWSRWQQRGDSCMYLAEHEGQCQRCARKPLRWWQRQRPRWSVQRSCRQAWPIKRRRMYG